MGTPEENRKLRKRIYNSKAWKDLREEAKRYYPPVCFRCQQPIDMSLPATDRMSWALGHRNPIDISNPEDYVPDIMGVGPLHMACNSQEAAHYRNAKHKNLALYEKANADPGLTRYYADTEQEIEQGGLRDQSFKGAENPARNIEDPKLPPNNDYMDLVPPRLESPPRKERTGSYAPEVAKIAKYHLGYDLRPWQMHVLDRALEHDENGDLLWSVVVVSCSRQSGKSVLLQSAALHRLMIAGRWNEREYIIHMASQRAIARLIWEDAMRRIEGRAPFDYQKSIGNGQEMTKVKDEHESTWRVVACSASSIPGVSSSMIICDEAHALDRTTVDSAAIPTTLARKNAQTWIVSTAGDDSSDLLISYRDAAVRQYESDEPHVLVIEWSAPPGLMEDEFDDEDYWKMASPFWDSSRRKMMRQMRETMSDQSFRTQMLNLWSRARNAAINEQEWAECASKWEPEGKPDDEMLVVEASIDGDRIGAVVLNRYADQVFISPYIFERYEDAYEWLREYTGEHRGIEVIHHQALRLPDLPHAAIHPAQASDQIAGFGVMMQYIRERRLRHFDNEDFTLQMLSAVPHAAGEQRKFVSQKKSPRPVYLIRALCWGLARLQEDEARIKTPSIAA